MSKNGIPERCFVSLVSACKYCGVGYSASRRLIIEGKRVVVRKYRITELELEKIRGRGRGGF